MRKRIWKTFVVAMLIGQLGLVCCSVNADIRTGLVGYWDFNEGQGDLAVDKASGYVGTLMNGAGWTDGPEGFGKALLLDGVDDYCIVQDGSEALNPTDQITIAAWVFATWPTGENPRIMQKGTSDNQYRLLAEWGNFVFHLSGVGRLETPLPPSGKWIHFAATYDGSAMKIYFDGVEAASMDVSGTIDTTTDPLYIGTKHNTAPSGDRLGGIMDEVRLYNRGLSAADVKELYNFRPIFITNPQPANYAKNVPLDTILTWDPPQELSNAEYLIHFGTDPNMPQNPTENLGTATSYDPLGAADLDYETTYYWQVDVIDPNDGGTPFIREGNPMQFTTVSRTPIFTADPVDIALFPGETAVFTVEVEDADSIVWYSYDPNSETETMLTDGGDISGATTTQLTIANVSLADQLQYFCRATNSAGPSDSAMASLKVKVMIAHWPLDGDLTDVVGGHNGSWNGDPCYSPGIVGDGMAINLNGVDKYITVGSVGISGNMPRTIACWVKARTTSITDWTDIFGFTSTPNGGCYLSFDFNKRGGQNQYCIHAYCWEQNMIAIDKDWHFLAATYDGTTVTWYADGKLVSSGQAPLNTQDNVQMGKRGHNEAYFPGLIDDPRIYNYALTAKDVAELYTDVTGERVCLEIVTGDFNQDCVVDVQDLQALVAQWLECNIVPRCK